MVQYMLRPALNIGFVDKRKLLSQDDNTHIEGPTIFTANAAGSTTTIVGANATVASSTNVVRIGDRFKLHTSSGILKEEKVFTITAIASSTSTTVTFSPSASVATASGDIAKLVGTQDMDSISDLNSRLNSLDSTAYATAKLDDYTANDKAYAARLLEDSTGV